MQRASLYSILIVPNLQIKDTDKVMVLRRKGNEGSQPRGNTMTLLIRKGLRRDQCESFYTWALRVSSKDTSAYILARLHPDWITKRSTRAAYSGKTAGCALGPGSLHLSCLNVCLRRMHHHGTYFYHFPSPAIETRIKSLSEKRP